MSGTIGFYKHLRAMGVDEQTALLCAEEFDKAVKAEVASILEPRRERDRERKRARAVPRNPRNSAEITESAETLSPKNRTESLPTSENLQTPIPPKTPLTGVKKVPSRASRRCPADWVPKPALVAFAETEGFSSGELERELSRFRDYEFGVAHTDWDATFRNWIRKSSDRKPKHGLEDPKYLARQANLERSAAAARVVAQAYRSARGDGREPDALWEDWDTPRRPAVVS